MKIKLLFQGDSITDAGRNFEDYPHRNKRRLASRAGQKLD